MSKHSAKH